MNSEQVIKGKNCHLVPFGDNEVTIDLIYRLFNDERLKDYLNPDYPLGKSRKVIQRWVVSRIKSNREAWYLIIVKNETAGYVAYKWKPGFDLACEISTALLSNIRGNQIGFESSKIMIENIASLNKFRYITAFCTKSNKAALGNLKKLGFRRSNRLHVILEKEFYQEENPDPVNSIYQLMVYNTKK